MLLLHCKDFKAGILKRMALRDVAISSFRMRNVIKVYLIFPTAESKAHMRMEQARATSQFCGQAEL